jgi:hypothetical protein
MSTSPARSPAIASPRRRIFAPLHRRAVAYSRRCIAAPSHRRVIASPHHSTVAVASLRRFLPLCVCVRKRACIDRAIGLACTFEKGSTNGSSRQ